MIATKEEWHDIYKARIKDQLACNDTLAEEVLQAGIPDFDYKDNPIEAADEELSYWGNC